MPNALGRPTPGTAATVAAQRTRRTRVIGVAEQAQVHAHIADINEWLLANAYVLPPTEQVKLADALSIVKGAVVEIVKGMHDA